MTRQIAASGSGPRLLEHHENSGPRMLTGRPPSDHDDTWRVLPPVPHSSLDDYLAVGGGAGLAAATAVAPDTVIEEITASGLRGRGGAGFPTGVKWRTVKDFASPLLHTTIVVNGAEGEPGTFKDRSILRANPYAVIEGALIAAHVLDARSVVIATKAAFTTEVERLRSAIAEVVAAGWCDTVTVEVVEGPSEYLYGEETALLEVIDGRPPFPRIAPPFRRGVVEVVRTRGDAESGSGLAASVEMAGTDAESVAPPVLVNNVETMANIPAIVARGAEWFRRVGTQQSPGTVVCTVTGAVEHPGVAEVPMGTTLRTAIELAGGGIARGQQVLAVLVGVSSAVIVPEDLDVELTHEAMRAVGSGLGSAGFIVVGDDVEPVSLAAGASRFLAIESCGQCTHCKQDGGELADLLATMCAGNGDERTLRTIEARLRTVADGARCSLASQQQTVVGSILGRFGVEVRARVRTAAPAVDVQLITELVDIDRSGVTYDTTFPDKQPDWTYDAVDSGAAPAERLGDHRQQQQ